MADEVEAGTQAGAADGAADGAAPESRPETAAEAPAAPPERAAPSWGMGLLLLALAAVLLTAAGVFDLAHDGARPVELGVGLLLWGLLDLSAQARGLVAWKGPQASVGNVVNLLRGLALLGLGVWLMLDAMGVVHAANPAVILWTLVCLIFFYLAATLVLEMLVQGLRVGGQAFLLAALVLMFFSYFYFSIPFTFSWAAVLAALAFAFAALALHRGALGQSRPLTVAVLLVLLGMASPLLTFAFQQAYLVEEQPLFTPNLLVPRMTQILTDLGPAAGQVRWAPVHTQPGQPGDVLFSDKLALVDTDRGQTVVKLFQQHESGMREVLRVAVAPDVSLTAFSNDGRRLSYTDLYKGRSEAEGVMEPFRGAAGADTPTAAAVPFVLPPFSIRHIVPWVKAVWLAWRRAKPEAVAGPLYGLAYRSRVLDKAVAPGPSHGQVWRALGAQLYFGAPAGGPRDPLSAVWRYDFNKDSLEKVLPGRAYPAVSADGESLLSVGFTPRTRYFGIADERRGEFGDLVPVSERRFEAAREASHFPAWNQAETEVLYMDAAGSGLMIMDANGRNRRPFSPDLIDSERWKTSKHEPFLLRWRTVGDTYSVYRSKPDGSAQRLVYATEARDISPPQWSDDGKRVAFIIRRADGTSRIFTVGSDGSWPRFFFATSDALDELKWSPDSLRLAWICRRAGGPEEIWTAGYEGLDPAQVHADDGHIQDLTWSPRGKHLAVQRTAAWTFLGLRIIRPDLRTVLMVDLVDRHARVMTRYGLMSWDPAFSPHGEAIAYFTDEHPWTWRPLRKRRASLVVSQLF